LFQIGTVFKWLNFPFTQYGNLDIKTRWFIYLGRSSKLNTPVFLYIGTTTSQTQHYDKDGCRSNSNFIRYKAGEFGFDTDCVLDIDADIYDYITESDFNRYSADHELVSVLPQDQIRRIYNKILQSNFIGKKIKMDIHSSLNLAGITNLKKPK
jgi:hypothetical protein